MTAIRTHASIDTPQRRSRGIAGFLVTTSRAIELFAIVAYYAIRWLAHAAFVRAQIRRSDPRASGRRLACMFERMGPTYVKLGQLLSSRPDLIAPETAGELARLRNSGSAIPTKAILDELESSLRAPIETLFARFDERPLAVGSIAQVHRATLTDGRTVAVKVRKPSVAMQIEADFAFLTMVGRVMERLSALRAVPIVAVMIEMRNAVAAQSSFTREKQNNLRFAANFSEQPSIIVPALVPHLCSDAVLTMELIENLVPISALALDAKERADAARAGLRMLYQMIFHDGFAHADLHPGNVFFRRRAEVAIIDFGLVARLDPADVIAFRRFFLAMATNDGETCARIVLETADSRPPRFDREAFEEAMKTMVDRFAGQRVKQFEVAHFTLELFDLQRRFSVRGSTAFTMMIVSLLVFEGIVKTLHPDLDFQSEASRFLLAPSAAGMDAAERATVFESMRLELQCASSGAVHEPRLA